MLLPAEDKIKNGSEYFLGILIIVVTAVGYRECFLANGGSNGVDFLNVSPAWDGLLDGEY